MLNKAGFLDIKFFVYLYIKFYLYIINKTTIHKLKLFLCKKQDFKVQ